MSNASRAWWKPSLPAVGVMAMLIPLAFWVAAPSRAAERMDQDLLNEIRDSLAWDFESIKSVELKTHQEIVWESPPPNLAYNIVDEHYIDDMNLHKFYGTEYKDGDKIYQRTEKYQNGPKSAYVSFDDKNPDIQTSIIIKRDFGGEDKSDKVERPKPILYWYVGRTPLHQAIDKAEYGGKSKVGDREAHAFIFKDVKWPRTQDHVFYIDAASRIPIKVAAYRTAEDRAAGKPIWAWSALEVEEIQGRRVPVLSEMVTYDSPGGSIETTLTCEVQSMKFDQEFPASTFWPEEQPGVSVLDALADRLYHTPEANPARASQSSETVGVCGDARARHGRRGVLGLGGLGAGGPARRRRGPLAAAQAGLSRTSVWRSRSSSWRSEFHARQKDDERRKPRHRSRAVAGVYLD